ncbi:MAG: multicopper oxidase family protein [Actinomycetota bacterium]|nr:multicopper oxidase family protein [Actinomycetota bacterium]
MAETKPSSAPPVAGVVVTILLLAAAVGAGIWLAGSGDREGASDSNSTSAAAATGDPCAFAPIDVDKYGRQELVNPPEISSRGRVLKTKLRLAYTKRSKTQIAGCPVHLRTYNRKLVGPTLRLKPGHDLDVALVNDLPEESRAQIKADRDQETRVAHVATVPHSFNTTNLHTHGLHVSPRGNSDNVLLAVAPQTTQPYHVEIPKDHAPGTFWYHAHGHGSTAIQVGSGAAGTIVIEDDAKKIPPALAAANEREKVMVFQTILYDAQGEVKTIEAFFPSGDPQDCKDGRPTCIWADSHRLTTINGQIVPQIHMQPGEVQRWRMVGGAFREGIELELEDHELHEIALDGLYLGRVDTWAPGQSVSLQPGYRSDVLVQASSSEGTYELLDMSEPPSESLRGNEEDRQVVAEVVVGGDPLDMELPTDEEMAPLAPFGDLDLSKEAEGIQVAEFNITKDLIPAGPGSRPTPMPSPPLPDEISKLYFHINHEAFDPQRVRRLALGTVDAWSLRTSGDLPGLGDPVGAPHVFHIHVNPFQYEREGPDGPELVWKDTVVVEPGTEESPASPPLTVYTQYTDFTGKFVIHCHILDHEDLGMMQVVKVVKPRALVHDPTGTIHH